MNPRRLRPWLWLGALALALAGGILLLGGGGRAASSSLSPGPEGWLVARRYLEERGTPTRLLDTPLDEIPGGQAAATLVITLPLQRLPTPEEGDALAAFLRRGGTALLAPAGGLWPDPSEKLLLERLDLGPWNRRPLPPISPTRWWSYAREVWALERVASPDADPVLLTPPHRFPAPPAGARPLLRRSPGPSHEDEDEILGFEVPVGRGRLVVLPAGVLANPRLTAAGNAELLEALRRDLPAPWWFDEYHHGLADPGAVEAANPARFAFDLFALQLLLLYALGLLALARRFGPPWRESPATAGSTAAFLRGLGALHHRLGHHRRAAELLVERAAELDPRRAARLRRLEPRAHGVESAGELLALARAVSTARAPRHPPHPTTRTPP